MTSKKYQIFVSSTFSDLKVERNVVSKSILDLGHIPAGMELFPAADTQQLVYIKKVIDECDYYLLVVGGRYGSITPEGLSYTEVEYNYAVESGIPVLAFVHSNLESIPLGKSEVAEKSREKLMQFRDKVQTGRLIQFWESADSLQAKAIISLTKAFSEIPRVGWMRADTISSIETREELIRIKDENDKLRGQITTLSGQQTKIVGIAGLGEIFTIRYQGKYKSHDITGYVEESIDFSLNNIFLAIGREFYNAQSLYHMGMALSSYLKNSGTTQRDPVNFNQLDLEAVMVQLVGLGIVKMFTSQTTQGGQGTFYQLTVPGQQLWLQARVRRETN